MSIDVSLVLGTVLILFGIPAIMSARVDNVRPIFGRLLFLSGSGWLIYAYYKSDWSLSLMDIPMAFIAVAGMIVN